jgi:hypothetical protein
MIEAFGLHWHLDRVNWGRQNSPGTLLGSASRSARAVPVDFREQRGIYALYGDYELIYIGQTGAGDKRLFSRLRDHKSDHLSERWNRFSWFGTQWVTKQHELSTDTASIHSSVEAGLNVLEAICIAVAEPRLNLQRGRWGDATQYFQCVKDAEGDEDE